jgi:hypothetical protein
MQQQSPVVVAQSQQKPIDFSKSQQTKVNSASLISFRFVRCKANSKGSILLNADG